MSDWTAENIKKVGLRRFTRRKFEYAISKSMNMEVNQAVEMFMEIADNYASQKIIRMIKESRQTGMFEVKQTAIPTAPTPAQEAGDE